MIAYSEEHYSFKKELANVERYRKKLKFGRRIFEWK